jgi:hypothetical protein
MATKNNLTTILNQYPNEFKKDKSTRKKQVFFFKVKDRVGTQKEIEKELTKQKYSFFRRKDNALSGSTEVTVIDDSATGKDNTIVLVFKPASGGMAETTLNSTITELAPALAFESGYKPKSVEDFYSFLKTVDHGKSNAYVAIRDVAAGKKFVDDFPSSSKFKDKMENAMGVLDWLYDEDKKNPIKCVYWGYRQKPAGVDVKHKGDLFVEYKAGNMLGVSLKAGDEKSKEPKLNTYVKPILESLSIQKIDELRQILYKKVYEQFGVNSDYDKTGLEKVKLIKKLAELEKKDAKKYNELYDINLDLIRQTLTETFEKNVKNTTDYLQTAIVGKSGTVPLLVLKAYSNKVKVLTDEDDVGVFLPKTKKIKSYSSTTSKQDFYIELISTPTEKLKMKFSVRTNKTGDLHKLGQFFNLAVKFNGIV